MPRPEPFVVHEDQCRVERWEDPPRGEVRWRTLLSADRTPTAALTVGVVELEPERAGPVRVHRHAQPEIYYVLSGEGVVAIDGREHPVRPGSAVFVPGGLAHGVQNTGTQTLRILYAFAVDSFDEVEYVFPETPDA